eukprot:2259243-Pyramimonas_sp.AAC.1
MGPSNQPCPSEQEGRQMFDHIASARALNKFATTLLPEWPRLNVDGVERKLGSGRQPGAEG